MLTAPKKSKGISHRWMHPEDYHQLVPQLVYRCPQANLQIIYQLLQMHWTEQENPSNGNTIAC